MALKKCGGSNKKSIKKCGGVNKKSIKKYGGANKKSVKKCGGATNKKTRNKKTRNKKTSSNEKILEEEFDAPPSNEKTLEEEFDDRIKNKCFSVVDVIDLEPFEISDEEALVKFTPPRVNGEAQRSFCYKKETFNAYVIFRLRAGEHREKIKDPTSKIVLWNDEALHKVLNEINESLYRNDIDEQITTLNNLDQLEKYAEYIHKIIDGMENSAAEVEVSGRGEEVAVTEDKKVFYEKLVTTLGKTKLNVDEDEDAEEMFDTLQEMVENFDRIISNLIRDDKLNKDLAKIVIVAFDTFHKRLESLRG